MTRRVFGFELNEKPVLGFDTGLNAQAFAQAKMAQFITRPGSIVYPNGKVETWQPGGVIELAFQGAERQSVKTMVIWGPPFPGKRLDELLSENGQENEALASLCFWLRSRMLIENKSDARDEPPFPGPAGALIICQEYLCPQQKCSGPELQSTFPKGTVFFPPARLLKRSLEADRTAGGIAIDAERWVHPDLERAEAVSFSAGTMLYRIFCGVSPFVKNNEEELHQDIREGVFIPPHLAAPGIDPEMANLITQALSRIPRTRAENVRPTPEFILDFIGAPLSANGIPQTFGLTVPGFGSKPVSSWFRPLNEEESNKINLEKEQYIKKKALSVKTRRFVIRNAVVIGVSVIAIIVLLFAIRGAVQQKAELPTTKGMDPVEVAESYYNAFDTLDHTMMKACVTGEAGRGDIDMAANMFVINRVRQAYDFSQGGFLSAKDWVQTGRPATDKAVFGITDLQIHRLSETGGNVRLEANYTLWLPGADSSSDQNVRSATPAGQVNRDMLELVFKKGLWQIAEINRTSSQMH